MNLLELDGVTKTYSRGGWFNRREYFDVLSDISFAVEFGSSVGIIGRSGAGKSTLGRLILGLERPNNGCIRYKGKDMADFTKQDWQQFRGEVQVVFQNALGSVNPRWQACDIIAEPLRNRVKKLSESKEKEQVARYMVEVGLNPGDMEKYPHQFSGGQLQRICIARALSIKPQLIVLDEAVSSLDMLIQAQILQLLCDLQKKTGVSYLFVSHDIRIIAGFCDKIVVVDKGIISSEVKDISQAASSSDPVLQQLANAVLPAWPQAAR